MKHTSSITSACLIGLTLILPPIASAIEVPPKEVFAGHKLIEDWSIREAETFTNILLKKYPESGDAYFLKARVEFSKGNYEYAVKILNQVGGNYSEIRKFKKLVHDTHKATESFISRESNHFIGVPTAQKFNLIQLELIRRCWINRNTMHNSNMNSTMIKEAY